MHMPNAVGTLVNCAQEAAGHGRSASAMVCHPAHYPVANGQDIELSSPLVNSFFALGFLALGQQLKDCRHPACPLPCPQTSPRWPPAATCTVG